MVSLNLPSCNFVYRISAAISVSDQFEMSTNVWVMYWELYGTTESQFRQWDSRFLLSQLNSALWLESLVICDFLRAARQFCTISLTQWVIDNQTYVTYLFELGIYQHWCCIVQLFCCFQICQQVHWTYNVYFAKICASYLKIFLSQFSQNPRDNSREICRNFPLKIFHNFLKFFVQNFQWIFKKFSQLSRKFYKFS